MRPTFLARLATVLVAGALVAACGGGQVQPFAPTRVLAFGDELSTIEADGRKYSINGYKQVTVNGTATDDLTTLDCTRLPIWIQTVAAGFRLAFDRCLGTATAATGQVLARPGQKVADFAAQVAAVQGTPFGEQDLALVMFGLNDILELYGRYTGANRDALIGEARTRGAALGGQVNALAQRGPAVVVLTVPDIGLSPFALAQNTASDTSRSKLISDLVATFNNRMSVELINDGRLIGLVYADIEVQNNVKFKENYGLVNVTQAACQTSAVLPACTTASLVTGAGATTWLWADSLLLSPAGQTRLGQLAESRARNNPF